MPQSSTPTPPRRAGRASLPIDGGCDPRRTDTQDRRAPRIVAPFGRSVTAPELLAWSEQSARPLDSAAGGGPTFAVRDPGSGADRATVRVRRGACLWGPIRAAVGVDAAGNLTGLAIVEQNETPGLGARIAEPWFRLQFRGKHAPLEFDPEGTRAPAPDRVDAVTGATISSRAVRDLVNRVAAEAAP